jgi:hypothetical protein
LLPGVLDSGRGEKFPKKEGKMEKYPFLAQARAKIDDPVRSRNPIKFVIPAKAGIQGSR